VFSLQGRVESLLAESLEKFCGRAALLAGDIESHAGAGLDLSLDGGMADDPGKDERCGMDGEVAVPNRGDDRRVGRALLRDRRDRKSGAGRFGRVYRSGAVMGAVSSAAGRQIYTRVGRKGEQGRDERQAEE